MEKTAKQQLEQVIEHKVKELMLKQHPQQLSDFENEADGITGDSRHDTPQRPNDDDKEGGQEKEENQSLLLKPYMYRSEHVESRSSDPPAAPEEEAFSRQCSGMFGE